MEKETSHPPIPPNSDYFVKVGNGDYLFQVNPKLSVHTRVSIAVYDTPECWRPIIAAVARCAWMDEAAKIYGKEPKHYTCLKNSEEWRIWGEK